MQIFRRVITPKTTRRLRCPVLLWLTCLGAGLAAQTENVTKELQLTKWSGAINVPDPVAVAVDPQGRVYVTATTRRKVGDLDIREHRMWVPSDVGLTTEKQTRNTSVCG